MRRLFVESSRAQQRAVAGLAALWFVLAFALTLALDDPDAPGAVIYAPAVAVAALEFGATTGVAAALLATGLYVVAHQSHLDLPTGWQIVLRAVPFVVLGGLIGRLGHRLRVAEQAHERLLETANEGVWLVDNDGRTTFANRRLADLLGYDADELQRLPVSGVVAEGEPLAAAGEHDVALRHRDGGLVHALVRSSPVRAGSGELLGTLAMVTDLSALRRAEEQLLRAQLSRRQATELNDNIVQQLALARYALARGDAEAAVRLIDATLGEARRMISDLIGDAPVQPGDLRREHAAGA